MEKEPIMRTRSWAIAMFLGATAVMVPAAGAQDALLAGPPPIRTSDEYRARPVEVTLGDVAWHTGAIEQEDTLAAPGEEHGSRGTRRPRADDDDVIVDSSS